MNNSREILSMNLKYYRQKYNLSQEDIDRINESGDLDEMMDTSLQDVVSGLDSAKDEADSSNTIESFNNI